MLWCLLWIAERLFHLILQQKNQISSDTRPYPKRTSSFPLGWNAMLGCIGNETCSSELVVQKKLGIIKRAKVVMIISGNMCTCSYCFQKSKESLSFPIRSMPCVSGLPESLCLMVLSCPFLWLESSVRFTCPPWILHDSPASR